MPLVLVATLITLNVIMADEFTGPDLENTIAIALTAVFILPELVAGNDDLIHVGWGVFWKTGPVFLLFIGIILASICHNPAPSADDFGSGEASAAADGTVGQMGWQQIISWVGVAFVWLSTVPLFANWWRYTALKKTLQESAMIDTSRGAKAVHKRHAFVKKNKDGPNGGDLAPFEMWDPLLWKGAKWNEEELANMVSCDTYLSRRNEKKVLGPWKVKKEMDKKKTNADGSQKLKKAWLYFGPEQNQRDEKGHDIPKQYSLSRMFSSSA